MSETSRMGSGRVFPALPKHPDPGAPFATSWWGNAWIDALEESALDQARLARGRTYAREGAVDTITVAPGRIVAYVHGSRPRPYRAEIRMRTMLPEHWDRFLDVVATDPARIAALLDQEMPHALADAADRADVPLLPGARELAPSCTCPDRGHPCKHAAALAYQTARLLDADPFVLLLLRGGEEQDLLDELARRNARRGAAEAAEARRGPLRGAETTDEPRAARAPRDPRSAAGERTGTESAGEHPSDRPEPAAEATPPDEHEPGPYLAPAFVDGNHVATGRHQAPATDGTAPAVEEQHADDSPAPQAGRQPGPHSAPALPGEQHPHPYPGGDRQLHVAGASVPPGGRQSDSGSAPAVPGEQHPPATGAPAPAASTPALPGEQQPHPYPGGDQQLHAAGAPAPAGGGRQPSPGSPSARTGEQPAPPDHGLVLPGVPAREALATTCRSPLPAPLPPPSHPGEPPVLPALPGAPDPTALEFLITDAARRAHAFLTAETGAEAFPADDSPWHDAVRLAASHPGLTGRRTFSRQFAELARSVGRTPADLSRAAAAWRQGGEAGLATLETSWDPPAGPFDRARGALVAADLPRMTIHRNRLTNAEGTLQLRYGTDGRWYPYRSEPGGDDWWPEGEADVDPVGALAGVAEA
ncbi:SWIM zinc finger family protein [Streptomyces venezuelae]|uniref:SWIM zinc finger family protein n=1 Tax=Streptomyces venezuelae TaxID=54571 RepID=UPI001238D74C|nr:SWIM zinc finger family protein [Streptomyces venezuelae]